MENNQIKFPPKTLQSRTISVHLKKPWISIHYHDDRRAEVTFYLNTSKLTSLNIAAHVLIVLIVAVHYAVNQGGKSSVETLLNSLTPEKQLQFLSTKDKKDEDGKTAVQWAPADERKEIDKMLRQYMREADFEAKYGKFVVSSHLAGFRIRKWRQFSS